MKPPADLSPRTQTGAGYDLDAGEGRRIWDACREGMWSRAADRAAFTFDEPARGSPTDIRPRLGQGIFRVSVLDAYGRACAVSGEHSLPVLEAAHIVSFARGGPNEIRNGLALRSDLHRLFDRGYVTVDADHRFVVSRRLADDFGNGRSYRSFHGQSIALPADVVARPAVAALDWHRENLFLG